jgi:nucleotide-binding universal stress UspA family protein
VIRKETKNVFDRVLFAYYPLKFSDSVVETLRRIPCKELILLYVVTPILPPEASSKIMKQKVIEAEDILSRVKSELEGSMKVETAIRIGHPCEEIIRCAKEFKATCIALGSRPKRPILGSTTSYILSHSEIPVLVCKGIFEC